MRKFLVTFTSSFLKRHVSTTIIIITNIIDFSPLYSKLSKNEMISEAVYALISWIYLHMCMPKLIYACYNLSALSAITNSALFFCDTVWWCWIAAFKLKSHLSPSVYISTSGCMELNTVSCRETALTVGASVTISRLETTLKDLSHKLPGTVMLHWKLLGFDCLKFIDVFS